MGESLINDLSSDLTKIDLFLLAHDTPDLDPSQSVVNFLTDKYNLNGLCFAMSDYGKNIGVGAIRIASEILQSSNCQKALVMVLDQNTIPSIELNKNDYIDAGLAVLLSKREKSKSILIKGHEQYYFSYKPSLEKVIETFATEDILILNNLEKLEEHKQKYRSSQTLFELSNQIFKESYPSGTPFCLAQFDTDINKLDILKLQF
ncbi:hypothetical protein J32TS6_17000 [Virgibacillus pantothenticus]|nr:hypothetical protein J32TS6_17000 [Virgibacillus pantothenticus]